MKESKYSEILLNKNNKCLFSQFYSLTSFTIKGFKVIYIYIYIYIYISYSEVKIHLTVHKENAAKLILQCDVND